MINPPPRAVLIVSDVDLFSPDCGVAALTGQPGNLTVPGRAE